MQRTIRVEERDDALPVCPHCDRELTTVWTRRISGGMGKRYVYFCGLCSKVLGFSHRKGFWMG